MLVSIPISIMYCLYTVPKNMFAINMGMLILNKNNEQLFEKHFICTSIKKYYHKILYIIIAHYSFGLSLVTFKNKYCILWFYYLVSSDGKGVRVQLGERHDLTW